jgi:cytochrome c-type biogenesis protein CcmF
MYAIFGNFGLIVTLITAIFSFITINKANIKLTKIFTNVISLAVILSFTCLILAYVNSDFSLLNVINNSHTSKPLIYKIAGAWGNHEGSMLLMLLLLALMTNLFAFTSNFADEMKSQICAIQSIIIFGIALFIYATSNPFITVIDIPLNGNGLNPLLQDVGLATHPPILYTGYIASSLPFSATIIALLKEKFNQEFARNIRIWALFAWAFLTLGIGLGSWWAYRELGWGGYWFWDPVENASLMPWLISCALIHSVVVTEKKGIFGSWTALLSIVGFQLSILGGFLVRSGVVTSVHSFATDPTRGVFIFIFLSLIIIASMVIYALKSSAIIDSGNKGSLFSRQIIILFNNLFLVVGAFIILVGTMYPLIYEAIFSDRISIGEPYFLSTFMPLMLPLLFFVNFGSMISWDNDNIKRHLKIIIPSMIIGAIIAIYIMQYFSSDNILSGLGICFASSLAIVIITRWFIATKIIKLGFDGIVKTSIKFHSMCIAHLGLAIFVIGICSNYIGNYEKQLVMSPTTEVIIKTYKLKLINIDYGSSDNYLYRKAKFLLKSGDREIAYLEPQLRFYPVEQVYTPETDLSSSLFSDLYVAIGEIENKQDLHVRIYYRPFISWIWAGIGLMFLSFIIRIIHTRVVLVR